MRREFKGIYTIWLREITKFSRERILFASAMVTPLLWLMVFGSGMGSIRTGTESSDYRAFIFPGILGMTLLFSSMRSGISVIWDREFGFLKEILVAPVSRTSVVFGKAIGGATTAIIQGTILLLISFIAGIHLTFIDFLLIMPIMLLISLGFDALGLSIASIINSFEGFQTIMSFIMMPTFFLSGALFPLTNAPGWLKTLSLLNPLTYGVDAMRRVILNDSMFSIYHDVLILLVFSGITLILTSCLFSVKK
jgi:ABC-2 type transport system permease protein